MKCIKRKFLVKNTENIKQERTRQLNSNKCCQDLKSFSGSDNATFLWFLQKGYIFFSLSFCSPVTSLTVFTFLLCFNLSFHVVYCFPTNFSEQNYLWMMSSSPRVFWVPLKWWYTSHIVFLLFCSSLKFKLTYSTGSH